MGKRGTDPKTLERIEAGDRMVTISCFYSDRIKLNAMRGDEKMHLYIHGLLKHIELDEDGNVIWPVVVE